MRNGLLVAIALSILVGCAQQEKPQVSRWPDENFENQILAQQFKKKGANIFCDQKVYLDCYQIDRTQCLKALRPFRRECFEFATQKAGRNIASNPKFTEYYSICMVSRHTLLHVDGDYTKIGACLDEAQFDQEQLKRTLTPTTNEILQTIDADWTLEKLRREEK